MLWPTPTDGGEVVHRVDTLQALPHEVGIANVPDNQLDIPAQIFRSSAFRTVHLKREIVEDPHGVAAAEQFVRQM